MHSLNQDHLLMTGTVLRADGLDVVPEHVVQRAEQAEILVGVT